MPRKVTIHYHPELIANWSLYQMISDFAEGDPRLLGSKYLIRYEIEKDAHPKATQHYESRLERLRNDNFVNQYLTLHVGHMSRKVTISILETNAKLKAISEDVTGLGMDYEAAERYALELFIRDGRVGILVDSPTKAVGSKAEEEAANLRSYQVIHQATDIRNWDRYTEGPRRGQLNEVLIYEGLVEQKSGSYKQKFRRFTQPEAKDAAYHWEVLLSTGTLKSAERITEAGIECHVIEEGDGAIAEIPFVIIGRGPCDSLMRDMTWSNFAHMNLQSVEDNIHYHSGMQRNVFVGFTKEELNSWGESVGIMTPNETANVLSVNPAYPQGIMEAKANLEQKMHRQGKLQFNQLADDSRESPSPESKQMDNVVRQDTYNKKLDIMQKAQRQVWGWMAEFEGGSEETVDVKIDRDFGFDDLEAKRLKRENLWAKAREVNALEVQKQLLITEVAEMEITPIDGRKVEDIRQELYDAITALQEPQAAAELLKDLFPGGGGAEPGPQQPEPGTGEQR